MMNKLTQQAALAQLQTQALQAQLQAAQMAQSPAGQLEMQLQLQAFVSQQEGAQMMHEYELFEESLITKGLTTLTEEDLAVYLTDGNKWIREVAKNELKRRSVQ